MVEQAIQDEQLANTNLAQATLQLNTKTPTTTPRKSPAPSSSSSLSSAPSSPIKTPSPQSSFKTQRDAHPLPTPSKGKAKGRPRKLPNSPATSPRRDSARDNLPSTPYNPSFVVPGKFPNYPQEYTSRVRENPLREKMESLLRAWTMKEGINLEEEEGEEKDGSMEGEMKKDGDEEMMDI